MVLLANGNVGIGTTNPAVSLDFNTKTDGVRLPVGTTAQRPTGATGIIRYNTSTGSLETYSNSNWSGITEIVATATGTSQTANIGATTLYTPSVDSYYRIDCVVVLTTVATTSSTLPTCTLSFTDSDSNTAVSRTISNTNAGNTLGLAAATLGNPFFYAKGSTAIQYSTTGYASSGATAMQYSIRIKLTRMP